MKIAIITDIHFDVRNGSQFFIDKYKEFFDKQFFPYLDEHEIKTLLIGGDTWENRQKLSVNTMTYADEMFFEPLHKRNIDTISIIGNHDIVFKNTNKTNSLTLTEKTYDNFRVVYENEVINFDGVDIAMVSWINKENYDTQIKFIETCTAPYMLGHFEINNFEMTKGHVCESGLKKSTFKHYDEVWSGHFHIPSCQDNIKYLGNPFQTNKGDVNSDRGFHVFDTDTKELTFIKNNYEIYDRIYYNCSFDVVEYDYEQHQNKIVILYTDDIIDDNDKNKFNVFLDKLNAVCYNISIEKNNIVESHGVDLNDIDIDITPISTIISEYVDGIIPQKDKKKLNADVKSNLNELYKECIENNMV